jgi:hypothetical protein
MMDRHFSCVGGNTGAEDEGRLGAPARLRAIEVWKYVEREVDIRVARARP